MDPVNAALVLSRESSSRFAPKAFVLVHGGFHGGWCWTRVASRLIAAGHRVYTPTNTGLGERRHLLNQEVTLDTFITDVMNVIETEELEGIHLVGHSFGGRTVMGVADRIPERVAQLVLLDTNVVVPGSSALDGLSPAIRHARLLAARESSGGVTFPVPPAESFGLTDPGDIAWLTRRMAPHPVATYTKPIHLDHPVGNGLPCTYIRCTQPYYPGVDAGGAYAKSRQDWRYLEIATGHDAMVTAPGLLADILLDLP